MAIFKSKKTYTSSKGLSCCFRQFKAESHCKYLHGYGVSFKLWFEGQLDQRNWVWDFGGMKRAEGTIDGLKPKAWFDYMFDHTFIVAEDDPFKESFLKMNEAKVAQVRVVPATGAERFAQFIYDKVNPFIMDETNGRVKLARVEFREHSKNSALYEPGQN